MSRYLCFSLFMETVAHHHGYCIVAVASEEPYSATYHITKDDWCGHDAPVKGLCPGAFTSQTMAPSPLEGPQLATRGEPQRVLRMSAAGDAKAVRRRPEAAQQPEDLPSGARGGLNERPTPPPPCCSHERPQRSAGRCQDRPGSPRAAARPDPSPGRRIGSPQGVTSRGVAPSSFYTEHRFRRYCRLLAARLCCNKTRSGSKALEKKPLRASSCG